LRKLLHHNYNYTDEHQDMLSGKLTTGKLSCHNKISQDWY